MDTEMVLETKDETENQELIENTVSTESVKLVLSSKMLELTVLLVEPDDSTRHILSALLRNCSYRVEALSDGLKAWEILNDRHHSIDLIVTEVDLSSISGFSLLTLIMDHDVCKHIPVIMMSSKYSVVLSLKCMLKGAADFLIKPVRKNELKNLWRHVWRRQTQSTKEHVAQNLVVAQKKAETACENNVANTHKVSVQNRTDCSDTQSSCTTLYMDTKSAYVQNEPVLSYVNCKDSSNSCDTDNKGKKEDIKRNIGSFSFASESREVSINLQSNWEKMNSDINEFHSELVESSSQAIDLISSLQYRPKYEQSTSSDKGITTFRSTPHLKFSLKGFHPFGSKKQKTVEGDVLNHSNSSPFSWYDSTKKHIPLNQASGSNHEEPRSACLHENPCCQTIETSIGMSEGHGIGMSEGHGATLGQDEVAVPCSKPSSCQSNSSCLSHAGLSSNHYNSISESACNRGDDSNETAASSIVSVALEGVKDERVHLLNGLKGIDCHRSIQREAALAKYRLKRNERCFDKKVRYQSRKILAEKRPRVKGQFVRHVHFEALPAISDTS